MGNRMIKKVFVLLTMAILLTSCSNKNQMVTNEGPIANTKSIDEELPDNGEATKSTVESIQEVQVGKTKTDNTITVTGEIITDGDYSFVKEYRYGLIYFVPDKESKEIIGPNRQNTESYYLEYDDISKMENLPNSLGIYKVEVNFKYDENHAMLINNIERVDEIGTILYEGKTYETNDLDFDVRVKDRVCGLIVEWVQIKDEGIEIQFAGEIESEGYYNICYNDMDSNYTGHIYIDEEYYNNFPTFKGERNPYIYFCKTNDLFDELGNYSAFGRGKFTTSDTWIIYNVAMGASPNGSLTKIVSLDENFINMFKLSRNNSLYLEGIYKEFIIVYSLDYEDDSHVNINNINYYYINKKNLEKKFLFTANYYYEISDMINEYEFILSSDGTNVVANQWDKAHKVRCIYDNETGIFQVIGK